MEPIVIGLITTAAAAGAAFGGVKVALNGTRERVERVEDKLDSHMRDSTDRLARIETKLDRGE